GHDPDGDGKGEPVLRHTKPALPAQPIAVPATSDAFDASTLGHQWQWQANPRAEWFSLTDTHGALRLNRVAAPMATSLWLTPHLLLQKFPAPAFTATTQLRTDLHEEGDAAGLMVFGYDYAWLGRVRREGRDMLVLRTCRTAQKEGSEQELAALDVRAAGALHLRVVVTEGARCRFFYSTDSAAFTAIGPEFQASSSHWVGAKVGLFAAARPGVTSQGYAQFDSFLVAP
ncbi:MAG TPA: glycoside hydrolase, partial [Acidobacteriota bacterium]|nr:glycoside hydrolase [Acidobacteriota bacterium]